MSETPVAHDTCPVCGSVLPEGARFCPSCGNRIEAAGPERDEFRDAIDAALGSTGPDQPTTQAPVVLGPVEGPPAPGSPLPSVTPPPAAPTWTATPPEPTWTATSEQWPADIGATRRDGWRRNRTLWIIVAIFGFIVFCCCGILFSLFIAASLDSSFQSEISMAAICGLS